MPYYDAHLHLQLLPQLPGPETLAEYRDAGIAKMVVNGSREQDWEIVERLAKDPLVRPAYGLHPWHVANRSDTWYERLVDCLDRWTDALIGEIGIDKWIRTSSLKEQIPVFIKQLDLALERAIPPSIHCLQSWGTLLEILRDRGPFPQGFLLHSYGGPAEMVEPFAQLGAYFSLSGYFARADKAKKLEAFRVVPKERLLIETDAPDMLPPPELRMMEEIDKEGKPINHPLNLIRIYDWAAKLCGSESEAFQQQIEENFQRLFGN